MVMITLRVDEALKARVDAAAEREGLTVKALLLAPWLDEKAAVRDPRKRRGPSVVEKVDVPVKGGKLKLVEAERLAVSSVHREAGRPMDGDRVSKMERDGRSGAPMRVWYEFRGGKWVKE